ncbi:MAG: hypothetical protein AAF389_01040 [Gemmatimonadota bacterium]
MGLLIALTGLIPSSPVRDAITGGAYTPAEVERPVSYLLGAPLFGLWDTLSLLTVSQHYAVIATLAALYVSLRRRARGAGGWLPRLRREAVLAVAAFCGLLAFYVGGAILPRPMVGLVVSDPDRVVVDFHSHTRWSHDGWRLFSAERNRAWHRAGGFDAAYVTDHYTWRGVDSAAVRNPARAGDGIVLLEGVEVRIHQRPTVVLGARRRAIAALDADSVYMNPDVLRQAPREELPPTLLYTMPGGLEWVVPFDQNERSGVVAIEINDASPRGLEQTRGERDAIIRLADSVNLALVGVSNLHGWGRTVASWSIMELPGWQSLTPNELGAAIEGHIHAERRDAVEVVERAVPYHDGSGVRVALTVPIVLGAYARALSWGERTSWLAWLLALSALMKVRRSAVERRGTSAPSPPPDYA